MYQSNFHFKLFFLFLLMPLLGLKAQQLIPIAPDQVYTLAMEGAPDALFDEQEWVGDPERGRTRNPVSPFDHIARPHNTHAQYVVDLGAIYQMQAMWLFDINASDTLFVYTGNIQQWQYEGYIVTHRYNSWERLPLKGKGRFLLLDFKSMGAKVGELVFYGNKVQELPVVNPPQLSPRQRPNMAEFLGVNAFNWNKTDQLGNFQLLREFREWGWSDGVDVEDYPSYPQNRFAWSPGYRFDADAFYRQMHNAGVEVMPCLQLSAPWLHQQKDPNSKPLWPKGSSMDPRSYEAHADYLFQFAARYGAQVHAKEQLRLRKDQKPLSGLQLIQWVENWNEPDKKWKGKEGYFNPFEFAALCSADYDGHLGKLGSGKGVKQADPQLKMAMGGLTEIDLNYLKTMKLWADHVRGSFPADAINLHHYSNDAGGQHAGAKQGVSPEEDRLRERLLEVCAWRDRELPGVEIWLSEFGYATHPNSEQRAEIPGSGLSTEEVQARWLVRSILEIMASGADRAFVFNLYDPRTEAASAFGSCGLMKDPWGPTDCNTPDGSCPHQHLPFETKASWYSLRALLELLGNAHLVEDHRNGSLHYYLFQDAATQQKIWAIWDHEEKSRKVDLRALGIKGNGKVVELTREEGDALVPVALMNGELLVDGKVRWFIQ